ncbi:phosphoglycerate mutase [Bacillus methanolicus PB1]|uniref:Phosphoglycerate mutase n=1 Tax=Bacillus methanolicus PB1 TaxID=997296 RepID=I3E070_BACMT|nr:histidine phosphatase family protein [Bacillus methanolicus]EIJ79891.1 phosphoglycerate mutase [Bacillus methanolicus PB1]
MLTLYITRHGETVWNAENRMQGRLDSSLTDKGKLHAQLLGRRLENTEFTAVITSPSGRTVQTAELIKGDRQIPIVKDSRLMEIHLGSWEGRTHEEIKEMNAYQFDCFWNKPNLYQNSEGESFQDVLDRVLAVLKDIEQTYSSGNVLIVTHAVVIKTMYMVMKQLPIEEFWSPPIIHGTSLTIVELNDGKKRFLLEADLSHVKQEAHL